MKIFSKSHTTLNKLVFDNENLTPAVGQYDTNRLYKLIASQKMTANLVIFLVTLVVCLGVMVWLSYFSPTRCVAQINLDFYPKQTSQIPPMENNQLLQVLSPSFVLPTIAKKEKGELNMEEKYFSFEKDSSQANRFVVTAFGKNNTLASVRSKEYANAAINLYAMVRQRDLKQWDTNIENREAEVIEKFKVLDTAEQLLNKAHNVTSLKEELESASQLRLEKEVSYREKLIRFTKQTEVVQKLENLLGSLPVELLEQAEQVCNYQEQIDELGKQINALSKDGKGHTHQATELKTHLADIQAEFKKFRDETEKTTKLSQSDLKKLGNQFRQVKEARETLVQMEEKKEEAKVSLEAMNEYMDTLQKLLPKYNDILAQRKELEQLRDNCEETRSCIAYLTNVAQDEFTSSDVIKSGIEERVFNLQKVLSCIILAAIFATIVGFVLIHIEAEKGNILSLRDLTFQPGLAVLGRVGRKRDNGERIYFRFKTAMGRRKTIFVGAMPGARRDPDIMKDFILQCALCGQKLLIIELVNAKTFEPPEDANIFATVSYKGDRGWMPMANMSCLSSSEQLLLEADLKMLSSDFDIIMIISQNEFEGKGVFSAQMKQLCDATMLLVGCNKTPRKLLRQFFTDENSESPPDGDLNSEKKPVLGILTVEDA